MVCNDAVDFLRHGAVSAPQPGFYMSNRHSGLRCRKGGRNSGVDVSVYEHNVGFKTQAQRLESRHDFSRLSCVGCRTDTQVVIGRREAEIPEKRFRHIRMVVLPSVYDDVLDTSRAKRSRYWRKLDEVGPR